MASLARYDTVADFYVSGQPDSYDADVDHALFDLIGPLTSARVVDIACGHGRITRELARRGASVVGVDIAPALIERAQQTETADPLGIDYVVGDIAAPNVLADRTFTVAVSNFGLSDIDDLTGALASIHRLLTPGGRFVFTILHPCFPGRGPSIAPAWDPGTGYYGEGFWKTDAPNSTLRQQVGANHRMLSTYLNALVEHGFSIDKIAEPNPPNEWAASSTELEPVPTFLTVRCIARLAAPPEAIS